MVAVEKLRFASIVVVGDILVRSGAACLVPTRFAKMLRRLLKDVLITHMLMDGTRGY